MKQVPIREVIQGYIGGGWGKELPDQDHIVPASVIRGTDLNTVQSGVTDSVPYRWHKASNARSRTLCAGDIVFEVSGGSKDQPVGRSLLLDNVRLAKFPALVIPASFCKRITPKQERVHPRFLHAHLQLAWADRRIIQWQVQSTGISNFNFEAFLDDFLIELPSLPTQYRIASILSAYDDLIEKSQRRIKILEAMARALYREWFVEFRFPGHENHPRVPSPLGEIPEGWEVRNVKDIATVTYGFPFASKKFNANGVGLPVIRIRDIPEGMSATFTEEGAETKYNVRNGHILVGMDGDFHMCIWSSGLALQNQRVARFESRGDIGNLHLFLALEKPVQEFNKAIVGTTVAHLGDMHIKTIQLVWPAAALRAKARDVLEPMSEQVIDLKKKIQNLRRTRDLLLPRFLSGQIELDEIEAA
jgi:type I restriction enzyme S subunit